MQSSLGTTRSPPALGAAFTSRATCAILPRRARSSGANRREEKVMDPATIGASVVALLVPYLKKAAEEFAGEAGKGAATFVKEKAQALWHRLRAGFAGDASALEVLD